MKVFKFGGASVKDANGVKNICEVLKLFPNEQLIIVVSAMGKTTNALERLVNAFCNKTEDVNSILDEIRIYHDEIMNQLFVDHANEIYKKVNNFFVEIDWLLEEEPRSYDFVYDQLVSFGELISSSIVSAYLNQESNANTWVDIRDCFLTDNNYREGKIDWEKSSIKSKEKIIFGKKNFLYITQGFIGSTTENFTTTLGREGSDYSAAILAHIFDAESLTIWKDVPGVLNADPKYFKEGQKLEQLSYLDAIELAYYGASVIHPKTIKPLENKGIPLYVKSFLNPLAKGTVIGKDLETKPLVPSFIFKNNQVLLSISSKDFSFIAEENLSAIFGVCATNNVKINLMQNSAISFSICADYEEIKIKKLIELLSVEYKIRYNTNLQLYTIRHYYPSTIDTLIQGREILLEQRSRLTAQIVMKSLESQ
jgi:aspartate kinase